MTTCPFCGAQNNQNDAAYCSYCGSSLAGAKDSGMPPMQPPSPPAGSTSSRMPPPSYPPRGQESYSFSASERYERALKRTEQLGIAIAILSVIVLILVII